jgi:N-carbamoyl-L-amino-acid hydrolase
MVTMPTNGHEIHEQVVAADPGPHVSIVDAESLDDAVRIAAGREITVKARRLSDQSPVALHGTVQSILAGAASRLELPFITMASGASHDAAHLAKHVPTGMVFVPCREGISHAPVEWADPRHIAQAVDVVVDAFRSLDAGASV